MQYGISARRIKESGSNQRVEHNLLFYALGEEENGLPKPLVSVLHQGSGAERPLKLEEIAVVTVELVDGSLNESSPLQSLLYNGQNEILGHPYRRKSRFGAGRMLKKTFNTMIKQLFNEYSAPIVANRAPNQEYQPPTYFNFQLLKVNGIENLRKVDEMKAKEVLETINRLWHLPITEMHS